MLLLPCPHCGPSDAREFAYGAPVDPRPAPDPATADDAAWADRLYGRDNARGPIEETWWHRDGCGHWIAVRRDTADDRLLGPVGQGPHAPGTQGPHAPGTQGPHAPVTETRR